MVSLIILIVFSSLIFLVKYNKKLRVRYYKIQTTSLLKALIIWIFIGFLRLDNNMDWIDIVFVEPVIQLDNILLSFISLTLISISLVTKTNRIRIILILIESAYFVTKLLFVKGGYDFGYSGGFQNPFVVGYDVLGLALRLFCIAKIYSKKDNLIQIGILINLLIAMKTINPVMDHRLVNLSHQIEKKNFYNRLEGEYEGLICKKSYENDSILPFDENGDPSIYQLLFQNDTVVKGFREVYSCNKAKLIIDSTRFKLFSDSLSFETDILIRSKRMGSLNNINDTSFDVPHRIIKFSKDSLIAEFGFQYMYQLKMKKENAY